MPAGTTPSWSLRGNDFFHGPMFERAMVSFDKYWLESYPSSPLTQSGYDAIGFLFSEVQLSWLFPSFLLKNDTGTHSPFLSCSKTAPITKSLASVRSTKGWSGSNWKNCNPSRSAYLSALKAAFDSSSQATGLRDAFFQSRRLTCSLPIKGVASAA